MHPTEWGEGKIYSMVIQENSSLLSFGASGVGRGRGRPNPESTLIFLAVGLPSERSGRTRKEKNNNFARGICMWVGANFSVNLRR